MIEYEKILFDIKYYRKEIELKKKLLNKIQQDFFLECYDIVHNDEYLLNKLHSINNSKTEHNIIKSDIENDYKFLFRDIVKSTHPDKNIDNVDYYNKAVQYKNNNDVSGLLELSQELGLYDISEDDIKIVKLKLKELKEISSQMENNIFFEYYNCEDKINYLIVFIRSISQN